VTLCEATLQYCTLCIFGNVLVNDGGGGGGDDDDDDDDNNNNNNNNTLSIRSLVANVDCQRGHQCRIISMSDNSCLELQL